MKAKLTETLDRTLADGRLSRAERREIRDLIEGDSLDTERVQQIRVEAFDLARAAATKGTTSVEKAFDWLEDVMSLVAAVGSTDSDTPSSQAFFSPGEAPRDRIKTLLSGARSSLDICVFTITDDGISKEIGRAHQRGVKVRVITDNDKSYDRGSDIEKLSAIGVPLVVDQTDAHMHHKFAIVDGRRLLNGSYNWTRSAYRVNEENLLVTDDSTLVSEYQREFNSLWTSLKH
ncbi:MAG: cardiolipin hydrolase [Myxococcota bacterium]|jgi:cardiolipin hydrolase